MASVAFIGTPSDWEIHQREKKLCGGHALLAAL